MREAIEQAAEATLLFLPPYSRDYNLIENAFSKLKALLRAKAERDHQGPVGRAVGSVLGQFIPVECAKPIQGCKI